MLWGWFILIFSLIFQDFFQLPPITKSGQEEEKLFCFESGLWKECFQEVVVLKETYRQTDPEFVQMLQEIRWGICSERTTQLLQSCIQGSASGAHGIQPTVLYPHNKDVDELNESKLSQIQAKGKLFRAKDRGKSPHLEILQASCPVPQELKLKIGAQGRGV